MDKLTNNKIASTAIIKGLRPTKKRASNVLDTLNESNLLGATLGAGLLGVPALVGAVGYAQQRSRNNIERDKEFEAQKRRIRALTQANNELSAR